MMLLRTCVFRRASKRKIRVASPRNGFDMNLAAILGFCLLSAGWLPPAARGTVPQAPSQGASASQPQEPPTQSTEPAQPVPSPTNQTPNSPAQAKLTPVKPRHHKKTLPANCSNAPTPLNTAVGKPPDSANSADTAASDAASKNPGSSNAGSTNAGATNPEPTNPGPADPESANPESKNVDSATLKPCPPPKKVVRNGGSSEPKVQLTGGTTAQQAANKSSTEQLRAATEENLKKAAALQLNPSQKEMVSQIKQFMQQSKAAIAAGDLERGHNLALKAHLLSDELVKP
jgi:hypothetical protein